jgi:hypothetical protein
MGLTDRFRALFRSTVYPPMQPGVDYMWPYVNFGGHTYPVGMNQTMPGAKVEDIAGSFAGYASAYKSNAVVFACMLARLQLFTEARFQYQRLVKGRPGDLFGDGSLGVLERPWPGGITADLLARAIQDADLAGNFFAVRRGDRITRLEPDWVSIIIGSLRDPELTSVDIDAEVLGYVYWPGGKSSGRDPEILERTEVAHFAPIPDPTARYRGMSWLTPVVREVMADVAATEHKLRFFENSATPNTIVTLDASITQENFDKWVDAFERNHVGAANAYKTLYLGAGADVTVAGRDLRQIAFKDTQGAGETRIAAAAGVPPVIVGLSEGLQAATYSNYGQARRRFADGTMRPLWRNMAGSLETIVPPPQGARLWYDDRDVTALQDDIKDRAEVRSMEVTQMGGLITSGFTPESIIAAVTSGDWTKLDHTGLYSVQLQPPMPEGPPNPEPPVAPVPEKPANGNGRSDETNDLLRLIAGRADPEVHLHIDEGAFSAPVTIAEGAIRSETTVEAEARPPMRTVVDYDPETNLVIGSHEEPV